MKKAYILLLVASATMLSGCNLYKKYSTPTDNAVINDYRKAVEAPQDSASLPYLGWEEVFRDPLLQNLIRTALANNTDLDNARLNVDAARAQLKGAKLSYLPSLALSPQVSGASVAGSHMQAAYSIPLALNWEVDIFGKILNRKRGAQMGVEQAEAYTRAVQSQIVCGVASTYYALVLLNQQLALTNRTAVIWKDQCETMRLLKQAGNANEAAVAQSEASYYSILASIPDIEKAINSTQNTLSLLMNTYPQKWKVTSNLDFDIPAQLVDGVPINYLAVRPDVQASEKAFAAAYYSTASARANFYPSLVLSANGGFTNSLGEIISNPGKWFVNLAAGLTVPIFSRGQNIATLQAAKANQQIALNKFQYSVLNAASEVQDAMVAYHKYCEKGEQLEKQIVSLEKSVEYTEELLTFNQSTTYLEVLTARSGLLNAQLASLQCWHDKVASLISLYQAVGGGR